MALEPNASTVTRIEVRSAMDLPTTADDLAEAIFEVVGAVPSIEPGDRIVVQLGYEVAGGQSKYAPVFTGDIERVESCEDRVRIRALAPAHKLRHISANLVYNAATHDVIIKKLLGQTDLEAWSEGVPPVQVKRSRYVFDEEQSFFDLISQLAREADLLLFSDPTGKLGVEAWKPSSLADASDDLYDSIKEGTAPAKHRLVLGRDLLDLRIDRCPPLVSKVTDVIHSDWGSDTETQILTTPKEAENVDGEANERALRTRLSWMPMEAAKTAVANLRARAAGPNLRGVAVVPGLPILRLGDGVTLAGKVFGAPGLGDLDLPESPFDAHASQAQGEAGTEVKGGSSQGGGAEPVYVVVGLRHVMDVDHGFLTYLEFEQRPPHDSGGQEKEEEGVGAEEGEEPGDELITIRVRTVDNDGNLLPNQAYKLVLPDGTEREGVTDANGEATEENCPRGHYRLILMSGEGAEEEEVEETEGLADAEFTPEEEQDGTPEGEGGP